MGDESVHFTKNRKQFCSNPLVKQLARQVDMPLFDGCIQMSLLIVYFAKHSANVNWILFPINKTVPIYINLEINV